MTEPGPMDDEPELDRILDAVLDLPEDERAAHIDEVCRGRPELAQRIKRIISSDSPDLLDQPVHQAVPKLFSEAWDEAMVEHRPAGAKIDRYTIVRELGRGGMGTVYLATRADGEFERQVAIKLVRPTLDPTHLRERFVEERRILARLEHDHIARLYDAGISDDGEPYFIMEYIDGLPLDVYADRHNLNIDARLALFEQICEAVQFAHQNLVVHRDLKPSNVLVTQGGDAKLLDFGVAKIVSDDAPQATLTRVRALTPEYASPEQLRGEPVSTASDIYTLGVLLYELLTGRFPYRFDSRSPLDIERTVRDTDPERPSAAVSDPAEPSRPPGASPRRLRGDLDNIVMMALRKEPERRYPSVQHLRDDLERHRQGLTVTARPSTVGYRARKFVGRNRVAVAGAVMILLAVSAGMIGTAWQAREAAREARRAERVTDFLTGLFEASDPDVSQGAELTARELLDRGATRIREELPDEPELRAELLSVIGGLYQTLAHYDEALPILEEALVVREGLHGSTHPRVASALTALGALHYEAGNYEAAEVVQQEALSMRRSLRVPSEELSTSVTDLAATLSGLGRYEEAEPLLREGLAIDRADGDQARTATDLNNLAVFLSHTGRYEESVAANEEALELRRQLYGEKHTKIATSLSNLGHSLTLAGDFERAEEVLRQSLALRLELLGDEHPYVANTLTNLATPLARIGRHDEAAALHMRALAIRKAVFGDVHSKVAGTYNNLGFTAWFARDYEAAASYFRESLAIYERTLDSNHPDRLTCENNLAAALHEIGKYDEAETIYRKILALRRAQLGDRHPNVAGSQNLLAQLTLDRGDPRAAAPMFEESLGLFREVFPEGHPDIAGACLGLGRCYVDTGRAAEAEPLLRESVAIRADKYGASSPRASTARTWLGVCLAELGRDAEAAELLDASLPILNEEARPHRETLERGEAALAGLRADSAR